MHFRPFIGVSALVHFLIQPLYIGSGKLVDAFQLEVLCGQNDAFCKSMINHAIALNSRKYR